MLGCVSSCVLEKIQEKKFQFQRFSNEEQQRTNNTWGCYRNKLTFKSHIKNLYKKASLKIGALSRLRKDYFFIL